MFMAIVYTINANLTEAIILSFQGEIEKSIAVTNMQWLSFYPCLYFFAMWDAWKDTRGRSSKYAFLPFVFAAYFSTVGCFYSGSFRPFQCFSGPVWLPLIFSIPGVCIGLLIQFLLLKIDQS